MKYLSYINATVLMVALLLSNFVIAWPDGFGNYFNVDNHHGETIEISANKDVSTSCNIDDWQYKLHCHLSKNGPLTISVISTRKFIICHTNKSEDLNNKSLEVLFNLPVGHAPIYLPKPTKYNNTKNSTNQSGSTAADITTIFTGESLLNIVDYLEVVQYNYRLNTEYRPKEICQIPLRYPPIKTINATENNFIIKELHSTFFPTKQSQEGEATNFVATGQCLTDSHTNDDWCTWLTTLMCRAIVQYYLFSR